MHHWFAALFAILMAQATNQGEDVPTGFVEVLPEDVKWQPNPRVPGSQVAVLVGNPQLAGPLVVRVKLPSGTEVMPHTHREARVYTVLAGEWRLGFGAEFVAGRLHSYPAGSVYLLPANVAHFQAAGAVETVVQIESIGPSSTEFIVSPKRLPKK
jgi:quercetin dioxygenase-like cupin family protein